jgi:hypothetical protein
VVEGDGAVDLPVAVVIVVGLALVTLIAIIVAPSRRVRAERPLPSDVEARVLLGESPRDIEAALNSRDDHAPEPSPPAAS